MNDTDQSMQGSGAGNDGRRSIAAIAREFGVTYRTLRFYESRGLLKPVRSGVTRHYRDEDVATLGLVLGGKSIGLTLVQIEQVLRAKTPIASIEDIVRALGDKIDDHLLDLRARRAELDEAIRTIESIRARWAT